MRAIRPPRRSLIIPGLVVVTLLAAGGALALRPAGGNAASPMLTTNTNAPCNVVPRKGYARCFAVVRTSASGQIVPSEAGPPDTALGPSDIQAAYGLPAGGSGQTVAIVDAYGDSTAESDLAAFRTQYGLPSCTSANGCFRKVDETGGTNYPADDPGWGLETSLDLDAVSAACPACNILLVEGNSPTLDDLGIAVETALGLGAKFVSNSYGASPEDPAMLDFDHYYNHQGVVVAAATGDVGNIVNWPSDNPNVVAVAGTTLTPDSGVSRGWDESAWTDGGSGCSTIEPRPDYQDSIDTSCPANRATGDISADADPASGLAVYDTLGYDGWLQVGGTSLATPLVTSMYALAGTPQPNTYPVTYPYHDPNQNAHLNDITTGSNGSCGNVLCTAGPGWDGPTGLGSPNGVAGLASGPQGVLRGTITDSATGDPVIDATVTAEPGSYVTHTDAHGTYRLDLAASTYELSVAKFAYETRTANDVTVEANQTVTRNIALTRAPVSTLSGTVTDGSGHGWPLHAAITITGYPHNPVYTNPATGKYRVRLPVGGYTVGIATDYPGYRTNTRTVSVGSTPTRLDVALKADLRSCIGPGYAWNGMSTDFTGWTGATPRQGWTTTGTPAGWRYDNPGDRTPPLSPPTYIHGADDAFAVADADAAAAAIDGTITSPAVDLAGQLTPQVQFSSAYYAASGSSATVQLSSDGGTHWSTIWQRTRANGIGRISIAVPSAAGKTDVRVRFRYRGKAGSYWAIDSVFVGTPTCVAQPGGLLVGVISDAASSAPINGARVNGTGRVTGAWPEGLAQATTDPAVPGGFYWLFSPSGWWRITATAPGYSRSSSLVDVVANAATRHDVALTAQGS